MPTTRELRFVWWNVGGLAPFDANRVAERGWPESPEAAEAQLERVQSVIESLILQGELSLIALGEITRSAAIKLRDRLRIRHRVFSLDVVAKARHEVAILFDQSVGLRNPRALLVPHSP